MNFVGVRQLCPIRILRRDSELRDFFAVGRLWNTPCPKWIGIGE